MQSLVFGYGGVRFNDKGVSMEPLLPPGATAMKLRGLNYAGAEFDVVVDGGGAKFARRGNATDCDVALHRDSDGVYWIT